MSNTKNAWALLNKYMDYVKPDFDLYVVTNVYSHRTDNAFTFQYVYTNEKLLDEMAEEEPYEMYWDKVDKISDPLRFLLSNDLVDYKSTNLFYKYFIDYTPIYYISKYIESSEEDSGEESETEEETYKYEINSFWVKDFINLKE